jgi:hypothetical protein
MKKQIPHGDEDLNCPFSQKAMSTVCHKCPMWVQMRGKNPQSNEEIDRWNCSFAFLPMLLLENAQQSRQGAAATESFRNEMCQRADANAAVLNLAALAAPSARLLEISGN